MPEDTIDLIKFDRELVRRRGFAAFIPLAWPHISFKRPGPLIWEWHLEEQANHWEALYRGIVDELVINIPPGHTKTMLASILFPAWVWTEDPTYRMITLSYDKQLATTAARSSLSLIRSKWYRQRWPQVDVLGGDRSPLGQIVNSVGGMRFTTFLGGPATGNHAHMLIADDPLKAQHAQGAKRNRVALENASETLSSTFGSRSLPGSKTTYKVGLVMQRLHPLDPSQPMIDRGACHLRLPALFEPEKRSVTVVGGDRRRSEGELLAPKTRPRKVVELDARRIGRGAGWTSPAVRAQLQQDPRNKEGAIFKGPFKHFTLSDMPFRNTDSVLSVDCSFKDNPENDFVGLEVWGMWAHDFYLYYSKIEHLGFHATMREIANILAVWPCTSILIEDAANGSAIIETFTREFGLCNVIAEPTRGGTLAKAHAAGAYYDGGRVYHLADQVWLPEKERNLMGFPNAVEHDDDTSATAQAILHLAEKTSHLAEALEKWRTNGMVPQQFRAPTAPLGPDAPRGPMFGFDRDPSYDPGKRLVLPVPGGGTLGVLTRGG